MNYFISGGLLVFAILLIVFGKAHPDGSQKAFLQSNFVAELYAVFCLALIATGIGFLVG